jgi:anthranilate phosphoribosyltransferase
MSDAVLAATIDALLANEDIGREGAATALGLIMAGEAGDAQTAAFLIALRAKGESPEEVAGLATVIRRNAVAVVPPDGPFIDTCGTGGGISTFNISTAAAFVAVGAGVAVAKHGNRSSTSKSGSAEVLEALGARIDLSPESVSACLAETGMGFMFAPNHHPAFRHVAPVRRAIGVRTIMNMIGPLANPAGARRQVIGVSDEAALDTIAAALGALGTERALVVRGRDGMDEISTAQVSDAVEVIGTTTRRFEIDPTQFGIAPPAPGALAGGEPAENADVIRRVFGGETGPAHDVIALNAGAALWVAGVVDGLDEGLGLARRSIESGAARERLDMFVATTQRLAPAA